MLVVSTEKYFQSCKGCKLTILNVYPSPDVALKIITVIDPDFGPLWNIRADKNLQITTSDSIQANL